MLRGEELKELKELKDIQAKIERHSSSGNGPDWRLEGQMLLATHQSLVQDIFWRLWLEHDRRMVERELRELDEDIRRRLRGESD